MFRAMKNTTIWKPIAANNFLFYESAHSNINIFITCKKAMENYKIFHGQLRQRGNPKYTEVW
jgi:hypothetical protein